MILSHVDDAPFIWSSVGVETAQSGGHIDRSPLTSVLTVENRLQTLGKVFKTSTSSAPIPLSVPLPPTLES